MICFMMRFFNWLFKTKRYNNCFTYPCAIVSQDGILLNSNSEFKASFDCESSKVFSDIVNITNDNHRIITESFNNKWELNYFQISKSEYHVLFFPYSNDNFLVNIPSPLAIVNQQGEVIHFNKEFQNYFDFVLQNSNLSSLFAFKQKLLCNVETSQEVNLDEDTSLLIKYKPTRCSMWTVSLIDNSEINEIKNKMNKAQHLQSLGHLIASISHDFNNMFTATSGFCEMLIEKTKNTEIYEEVREIMSHISSAQDLSKQLVKFVSSNDVENCIAYQVLSDLNRIAQKLVGDNITINFDLEDSDLHIGLSSSSLERMIINMIINSRDAISQNGQIVITLKNSVLYNNQDYMSISVEDNGSGIAKEDQVKVLKPFFTTKKDGAGLGLSNIAQIVKKANGKLDLQSNENGTTITILLPKVVNNSQTNDKVEEIKTHDSKNILVVEDEPGVRKVMVKALTRHGHNVVEAYNGLIALEKLKQNSEISLVITDASLPELSGNKLAAQINALYPEIKILVVSGYGEDSIKANFQKYDGFLAKPFTIKQLTSYVNKI